MVQLTRRCNQRITMCKSFHIALVLCSILLTGCTSLRQMTLFTGAETAASVTIPDYIIEPGDLLQIEFTAVNAETVEPYNSAGLTYAVQQDGTISVPVLGKITLAGKTTEQGAQMLSEMVKNQVKNPIVHLTITNAVVTILGEVNSPRSISVPHAITLTSALGNVGGLTKNAKCDNVLVQRRENGQIKTYHVNLLTNDLLTSPCYYLQKGDVVYVAPLHAQ